MAHFRAVARRPAKDPDALSRESVRVGRRRSVTGLDSAGPKEMTLGRGELGIEPWREEKGREEKGREEKGREEKGREEEGREEKGR